MNDLRLILLGVGLLIIAGIYLWENAKVHRAKLRSKPRVNEAGDLIDLVIAPQPDDDKHSRAALSDLDRPLMASKFDEAAQVTSADFITMAPEAALSDEAHTSDERHAGDTSRIGQQNLNDEHIILLYVTAADGKTYRGTEIVKVVEEVGMTYGPMGIFHHYGVNGELSEQPLFSLANMLEPGHFDLAHVETLITRGLAVFMRLPGPVRAKDIFSLMLDVTKRLADVLGGDVRSADHQLLKENDIKAIHARIASIGGEQ